MDENIPLSGQIDLDALDDYLMSDRAPDYSMKLSDLDGFLTGLVVGPGDARGGVHHDLRFPPSS